jgi:DNA polymerase-3 subunit delta'
MRRKCKIWNTLLSQRILGYNWTMNWGMIGQDWAVDLLRSHILRSEIRHAYLVTGPPGIGKRILAIRFAQALICEEAPAEGEFCGDCRACTLIWQNAYPDLHILEAGESDRSIRVEQIRNLQRTLSLSPYEGKRRLALLDGFHEATEQAANALLKTLEEPPPNVVLLLTANSVEALLPTIVSRCEVIALRPLPIDDLVSHLISRGEERERAILLANLAGGRPGLAIEMGQDDTFLQRRTQLLDELQELLSSDRIQRFAYVSAWIDRLRKRYGTLDERRKACEEVMEVWLGFWRDVMLVTHGVQDPVHNPDRKEDLVRIAAAVSSDDAGGVVLAIQRTIIAIDDNANLRLALENLMLELPYCNMEPLQV